MTRPLTPRLFALTAAAMVVMVGASQVWTAYAPGWRAALLSTDPLLILVATIVIVGAIVAGWLGMALIEAERDARREGKRHG